LEKILEKKEKMNQKRLHNQVEQQGNRVTQPVLAN
jgi:hypothetical protein